MVMAVREIIRFLDNLPLFPAEMTGTKVLNLVEESNNFDPMNFQKLHILPQSHRNFL